MSCFPPICRRRRHRSARGGGATRSMVVAAVTGAIVATVAVSGAPPRCYAFVSSSSSTGRPHRGGGVARFRGPHGMRPGGGHVAAGGSEGEDGGVYEIGDVDEGPTSASTSKSKTMSMSRREVTGALCCGASLSLPLLRTGAAEAAMTPGEASSAYDSYSASYDSLDGGPIASFLGIDAARAELLGRARGRVLEVGAGTGLNLEYYRSDDVTDLVLVDVSGGMLDVARERARASLPGNKISFVTADVTSSDLPDALGLGGVNGEGVLFDTVVDTFTLCVLGNEGAKMCLERLKRVVKRGRDGGRILLLENSRSSNKLLGWYQDATADAAASAGGRGCVYNQDVEALISDVGGLVVEARESYVGGLFRSFVCYHE